MGKLTKFLKLTKDSKTDAYDIEKINANLDKIDAGVEKIDEKTQELSESIDNIELTDEKIEVKSKSKKLNEVLKDIFNSIGILGNLNTLNKTNLVTAINEVLGKTSTNASEIQNNKEKLNVHQQHLESLDSKLTSNNSLFSEYNRRFRELNGGE